MKSMLADLPEERKRDLIAICLPAIHTPFHSRRFNDPPGRVSYSSLTSIHDQQNGVVDQTVTVELCRCH